MSAMAWVACERVSTDAQASEGHSMQGLKKRAELGKYTSAQSPYGYDCDPNRGPVHGHLAAMPRTSEDITVKYFFHT